MPSYLLLMQRSWCLFNQNFVFRRKKVENFRRYKLAIQITNSPVLNKLQSYSRISAVGPEGHCTSRFKRAMCSSCRPPSHLIPLPYFLAQPRDTNPPPKHFHRPTSFLRGGVSLTLRLAMGWYPTPYGFCISHCCI